MVDLPRLGFGVAVSAHPGERIAIVVTLAAAPVIHQPLCEHTADELIDVMTGRLRVGPRAGEAN
jgi:hypothetical protein